MPIMIKKKKPYSGVQVRRRSDRTNGWEVRWRDGDRHQRRKAFPTKETADGHAAELKKQRKEKGSHGLVGVDAEALRDFHTLRAALGGATIAQVLSIWERHKNELLGGEQGLSFALSIERYLSMKTTEGVTAESMRHVRKHLVRLSTFAGEKALKGATFSLQVEC